MKKDQNRFKLDEVVTCHKNNIGSVFLMQGVQQLYIHSDGRQLFQK